jgi:hypothetical protein
MAQGAVVANYFDRISNAGTRGEARGEQLAKDYAAGGEKRSQAEAEIADDRKQGTTMAYLDYAMKAYMATMGGGGILSFAGEKATEAMGGTTTGQLSDQAIQAKATVEAFDNMKQKATKAADALEQLALTAERATPAAAPPSGSIAERSEKRP